MGEWETVIGLECHVELDTKTKMFCGCRNEFGAEPNTNTCAVCVGHPGALPVPNREAIASIIKIGLALDCAIAPHSLFHRKNYFYPDMPKNFQISQYDLPICVGGHLDADLTDGTTKRVGITRVHMEEDTGKTTHGSVSGRIHGADHALIDYNRAGVPLVECVSEPDLRSPDEAAAYIRELRSLLEVLDVSDVRMEEGSLRCDANISLRAAGSAAFGTKVEIKNMNSIRSLERALHYEIGRQAEALDADEAIVQETRHWEEDSGATKSMRSKEEAFDYRYFPEPDIPPIEPSAGWIEEIRATLPELPRARRERYERQHGLKPEVARVLVADRASTELFERTVALGAPAVPAANWVTQDLAGLQNKAGVAASKITPEHLVDLIDMLERDGISGAGAKQALEEAFETGDPIDAIVERRGLAQVSDTGALGAIADEVIAENHDAVEQFRAGKDAIMGFLVGQVMKKSAGSANPKLAQQVLREHLQA
ncbi:MAG: Asp-tRNA(Asn)/Glu-tRNA(Gln) amidotransferase subunit GatB [Actinomycetota bacterium]|nr:Asp-tRNA(Asn)/Glu-tRNA(Gln) amidotransferase subunit GatB [Actinomycetota bacterium]